MKEVLEKLAEFPADQQNALLAIRAEISKLVPGATETIDWGMPSFRLSGVIFISYLGFSNHNSLFPGPEVTKSLEGELAGHVTTKGTIHFPVDGGFKKGLLAKILKTRISVINESFPKANGEYLQFYDNGYLKSKGRYKNNLMHGNWEFYRRDGSLMRKGKLQAGEPVGDWETFTR